MTLFKDKDYVLKWLKDTNRDDEVKASMLASYVQRIYRDLNEVRDDLENLEYERDYDQWDCNNCEELEYRLGELEALIPDQSIAELIIKNISDTEIVLENSLTPGQTWNWLPGNKLGLVK